MTGKNELIVKIKEKKELSGLADFIVSESVDIYLAKNRINLANLKPRELKILIKDLRAELRNYTGRFQKPLKEKILLLEKNEIVELLKSHASTRERIESYPEIKNLIIDLDVKSILDLGCGLNPIALASSDMEYYAVDINEDDLKIVSRFFEKNKIKGKTFTYDLRKLSKEENPFPSVDLCLILKVFDVIEKKGHKLAEEIIKKINCRYFLISFSTKTLSGAPMRHPQRGWIELLLTRLKYNFKLIKTRNELFYLASKS